MVAVLVALVKGMRPKAVLDGIVTGAKGVTLAAIILALAITIKGVSDALGTGWYVADLLGDLPAFLLPTLLLLAAMLVAFSTGTSFGTFAVLFPVAMPLAYAVGGADLTVLSMCFAAVVGGSVFGDKASPISDTTILSSLAVGCDVMDHVTTQMPYALFAAGLAAVLYLVLGILLF
jgi:Na+/H+ antiporter NhaC